MHSTCTGTGTWRLGTGTCTGTWTTGTGTGTGTCLLSTWYKTGTYATYLRTYKYNIQVRVIIILHCLS